MLSNTSLKLLQPGLGSSILDAVDRLLGANLTRCKSTLKVTLPVASVLSTHEMQVTNRLAIHISILRIVTDSRDRRQSTSAELLVLPDLLNKLHGSVTLMVRTNTKRLGELVKNSSASLVGIQLAPRLTGRAVDEAREAIGLGIIERGVADNTRGALVAHDEAIEAKISPPRTVVEDDGLVVVAELGSVGDFLDALRESWEELEFLVHSGGNRDDGLLGFEGLAGGTSHEDVVLVVLNCSDGVGEEDLSFAD